MKKEIREIFDFGELEIITEKTKLPKYALAKLSYSFARADSQNSNHRTYPESILSREINRKSEELRKGKIAGQLEHPLSGITKLDKVAHILSSVQYDRNTKLASAESFILDTSKGRDFMVLLDAELKMGVSMRGFGNVFDGRVQSDYKFDTVDFVLHPSFGSDATIDQSNIIESASNLFDEKEIKRIPVAPIQEKVTPASVYLEARIMGVDPKTYAEMLNKNLERQKESDSDLSPREVAFALEEARQSGIDTSDESERKKALDIFRKQKTQKVLTEDERAKIVAERTGSTIELVKEVWAIEKKKKAEEQKKTGKINLLVKEGIASGFGSEARPESRRISKKIIDKE
jgi:hypothetical protein